MSATLTGIMRFTHILSGIAWIGGAFLWSMVIAPRIMARGPPAIRRPFAEAVIPAITNFFRVSAILALLSGFVLVWMLFPTDYFGAFQGTRGSFLGLGAVAGVATAIVGLGILSPTGKKLLALMQSASAPPTPEQQAQMGAMGKKMGILSMVVVLLGTIATFGMVWAVNMVR